MLTLLIVNKKYLQEWGQAIKISNMLPIASGYIKKSNNICYGLTSNNEKYKHRDTQRSCFRFYPFNLCRFSVDFVLCVYMVPEYGGPYLASNSEVYSKSNIKKFALSDKTNKESESQLISLALLA